MTRTMDGVGGSRSLEANSENDEEFHSARESPSHGELGSSAALLAVQLAVACVCLRQRARLQEKVSGLPIYPVGLPRLKERRKRYTEAIIDGNLQHHSDGRPELPSPRVSHEGGYKQLSSDSCSSSASSEGSSVVQPWSMEGFSSFREKPWDASDDSYSYSPSQIRWKKDLQRASLQVHDHLAEQELEGAQDVEGLACNSNLCQDGEGSSCIPNHRTLDDDEDDDDDFDNHENGAIARNFKGILEMDKVTIGKLPVDSQPNSISSGDIRKARSCGSLFTQQDKLGPWSYRIAFNKSEDSSFDTHKGDLCEGSQATIVSKNDAAKPNNRILQSNDLDDVPTNGGPEQGQVDSLLLWPLGLVVEAIAFQVRLIAQAFSLFAILYDWCNSFATSRVRETWQAKERATEALSQKVAMITNVPPKVTESGSMVLKRAGWGCFAAIYVCILLSMLLFPALLLDYVFVNRMVEDPVSIKEPLHFDYTLPHPTAVVFLISSTGKPGSQSEHARPIPVSHKVHITVFLTLPESDYNRELGMFQLSAELLSETGETIKSSSRPCILRFHSLPIRMLKTFLISLPSLVGMFTESQTLEVQLMEFEEQQVATHVVRILVQPKAGMPLGQGIPEIYSAVVHIETRLPWLKNMVRSWKWTVYIWTGLTLYVMEIVMILCCCRQALVPKTWASGQNDETEGDQNVSVDPVEVDEIGPSGNPPRKGRVLKQRHSYEHIPTATTVAYRRECKVSPARLSSI